LSDEEYILHDTDSGGSFNVKKLFYPKVENVIAFFDTFKKLYLSSFANYKQDKVVNGYFPNPCEIIILGSEDGVTNNIVQEIECNSM